VYFLFTLLIITFNIYLIITDISFEYLDYFKVSVINIFVFYRIFNILRIVI